MAPFRLLGIFLIASIALNFLNYLFTYYYEPPQRKATPLLRKIFYPELNTSMEKYVSVRQSMRDNFSEPNNYEMTTTVSSKPTDKVIWCPETPPNLGPILTNTSLRNPAKLEDMFWEVMPGGLHKPAGCKARHSATIIIPYRGKNQSSLDKFLPLLHQFLMKQQLEYQILVVEQGDTKPYNHGWLLNSGFTEVLKRSDTKNQHQCIIFHEPYLIPMDTRNLYRCGQRPRQLAVSVEKPDKSTYTPRFGGAFAIRSDHYIKINGFSNNYWSNDADLEDMFLRLKHSNISVERSLNFIGTYTTLKSYDIPVVKTSQLQQTLPPMNMLDGLTTLSYKVNRYEMEALYTYLNVTLDTEEENGASMSEILFWNKIAKPHKQQ